MADRKFIVLNTTDVTSQMWSDSIEAENTARFNNDGSKVFLSHREEAKPASYGDNEEYTLDDIMDNVLTQSEWQADESDEEIPL